MPKQEGRYHIRVLDRALRVLAVLSDGKPRTLVELSEEIPLNNSTTYRLLATFAHHGYVEREEDSGKYMLGFSCLALARSYQSSNHVRRVALGELEELRDSTGETIHLAILDGMHVAYLEKLHGLHAIGLMTSHVGGRVPAYCTGLGKALLAYEDPERVRSHYQTAGLKRFTATTIADLESLIQHLALIRQQGYAIDNGEHEPEVHCVAAPIHDARGQVVAAVSISGPASRIGPPGENHTYIKRTVEAAAHISTRLGYRPNHA